MNKYYTPTIEQFKEGFKYEVKSTHRLDIMDFSKPEESIKGEWQDSWYERTVPNMDPIKYPYTTIDDEGNTWTILNAAFPNEDPLRQIKIMLTDGQIRAKR
tara:strand:- start:89663 stop:89965 length:303 start_codon:yes stop_codon:yes gene_type:complete